MFELAGVFKITQCDELDIKVRSQGPECITAAKDVIKIRYWNASPTQIYVIPRTKILAMPPPLAEAGSKSTDQKMLFTMLPPMVAPAPKIAAFPSLR